MAREDYEEIVVWVRQTVIDKWVIPIEADEVWTREKAIEAFNNDEGGEYMEKGDVLSEEILEVYRNGKVLE